MSPAKTKRVAKKVAVATIHEEDFSLDDLSVEELEKLRDKVATALCTKLEKEVPFLQFDYEPVDDRSMGRIQFQAKTVHGVLCYEGHIDSGGGIQDSTSRLAPEGRDEEMETVEVEFDLLDSLHADTDEEQAKIYVVRAVLDWAKDYGDEGLSIEN